MYSGQQVYVGLHQPNLQNVGLLSSGHGSEKPAKKPGNVTVYEAFPVTGGPDQMDIESVVHGIKLAVRAI
jgi:hypothetical protein